VAVAATLLTWHNLNGVLPYAAWSIALDPSSAETAGEVLFSYSALPRVFMALLSGAGLALSGTMFQQVLRNPLAEATTLGVSAGAQTGLLLSLLWAPGLFYYGQAVPATLGAILATAAVLSIVRGLSASPLTLIMAGLIVNLTLATLCAVLVLFYPDQAEDLSQWQTGRLEQNGWAQIGYLAPWLLAAIAATWLLARPLVLLEIGDDRARALGLHLTAVRPAALLVAILLAGSIVASVGIIGFVGLSVPAIARLLGARRPSERLIWAPLLGGALLWLTDQIVQVLDKAGQFPTGIFTALLGAPMLLLLLPRLRQAGPLGHPIPAGLVRLKRPLVWLAGALLCLILLTFASMGLGRDADGWSWIGDIDFILRWRTARVVAALSAGMLLGLAGTLMQKMTGNPMASPEILGVSSASMLGAIMMVYLVGSVTPASLVIAGTAGAAASLMLILVLGWRSGFSPERMILGGVALGTIASAIAGLMIARGGPERGLLLTWMSGSTYRVNMPEAQIAGAIAVGSVALSPLFSRWLQILPLGTHQARALGVRVGVARCAIIMASAVMTACATLIVGPASFIGLMAPHMVRMIGFQRPVSQLLAAAVTGGLIMVAADWAGRTMLFPWQVPAGLLATLVGAPYFLILIRRHA
jgi:iron complex transport system permease protein